jgi:hypothetical protein
MLKTLLKADAFRAITRGLITNTQEQISPKFMGIGKALSRYWRWNIG